MRLNVETDGGFPASLHLVTCGRYACILVTGVHRAPFSASRQSAIAIASFGSVSVLFHQFS
jgi:hypothetical protein